MEVSTEKSKVLNNSTSDINTGISKNSQKLKDVTSFFMYLGAIQSKDGTCSAETRMGITSAMAVKATLSRMNTRLTTRSEQDQRHCESTGVHFDHCHETETLILRACHAPRKSSKKHPSGLFEGRTTVGRLMECWMDNVKEWRSLPIPEFSNSLIGLFA